MRSLEICFFFQAEDGIRVGRVTGVQTCALPILTWLALNRVSGDTAFIIKTLVLPLAEEDVTQANEFQTSIRLALQADRSEERRVGKECSSLWWPEDRYEVRYNLKPKSSTRYMLR